MVASTDSHSYERGRSDIEEGVSQIYDAIAYGKINSDPTLYVRKTNLNTKPQ
jgi:hypothetical protein